MFLLQRILLITLLLITPFCLLSALEPAACMDRLPKQEEALFVLKDRTNGRDVGRLTESLELEDRYGLEVYVLKRRFDGPVLEMETIEFEKKSFIPISAKRIHKVRGMDVVTEIQFQATKAILTVREPELLGGKTSTSLVDIPRGAVTIQQLPYLLRCQPLHEGDEYHFQIVPLFAATSEAVEAIAHVTKGMGDSDSTVDEVEIELMLGEDIYSVHFAVGEIFPLKQSSFPFSCTDSLSGLELLFLK